MSRQDLYCFVDVLQGGWVGTDGTLRVYTQKGQRLVLFNAYTSEEGGGRGGGTIRADLLLHAPHKHKEALAMRGCLDGHVVDVLLTPEWLASVDHGLCLGRKTEEIDGGSQDNPVGLSQGRVYLLHSVFDDANPRIGAASAILARSDVHVVQTKEIDTMRMPVYGVQG